MDFQKSVGTLNNVLKYTMQYVSIYFPKLK